MGDPLLAFPDGLKPSLDLGLRPIGIVDQVEPPVFLQVEFGELVAQVRPEFLGGLVGVGARQLGQLGERLSAVFGNGYVRVVVDDGSLDLGELKRRKVAGAFLVSAADVVDVLLAGLALGREVDEPLAAAGAPDGALEVVVVGPLAGAGVAFGVEHFLHPVEQVLSDEGFVTAGVFDAVVRDVAEVVPVAEHLADAVNGDRTRAVAPIALGSEPGVGECVAQFREGVVAGGVQLERHPYERRAFGVDGDRADLAAFVLHPDVFVPEYGDAERSAVLGLLAHLVLDVFAGDQHLVFVEYGDHAVHRATGRAGVEVAFGGGEQGDAELFEGHHHDGVVVTVPREAGERVDDDVPNVRVGLEVGDHLAERIAVFDRLRRLPGVGEFLHDDGAEFLRARPDGLALRGE